MRPVRGSLENADIFDTVVARAWMQELQTCTGTAKSRVPRHRVFQRYPRVLRRASGRFDSWSSSGVSAVPGRGTLGPNAVATNPLLDPRTSPSPQSCQGAGLDSGLSFSTTKVTTSCAGTSPVLSRLCATPVEKAHESPGFTNRSGCPATDTVSVPDTQ